MNTQETTMTDEQFHALMHYVMATDPPPTENIVVDGTDGVVQALLDEEARKRGYLSWYLAFHEFDPSKPSGDADLFNLQAVWHVRHADGVLEDIVLAHGNYVEDSTGSVGQVLFERTAPAPMTAAALIAELDERIDRKLKVIEISRRDSLSNDDRGRMYGKVQGLEEIKGWLRSYEAEGV